MEINTIIKQLKQLKLKSNKKENIFSLNFFSKSISLIISTPTFALSMMKN